MQFHRYNDTELNVPWVQGIWRLTNLERQTISNLAPDGYPELVFPISGSAKLDLGAGPVLLDRPAIIGVTDRPATLELGPSSSLAFVKLMPWYLAELTHEGASEFKNGIVWMVDIRRTSNLLNMRYVIANIDPRRCIEQIVIPLLHEMDGQRSTAAPPLLLHHIEQLHKRVRHLSFNGQRSHEHCSQRYLEKAYKEHIGISPKKYLRLLKIKKASLILTDGMPGSLTSLAGALGYYDRRHLHRDFHMMTGTSPSEFIASRPKQYLLASSHYRQQYEYS